MQRPESARQAAWLLAWPARLALLTFLAGWLTGCGGSQPPTPARSATLPPTLSSDTLSETTPPTAGLEPAPVDAMVEHGWVVWESNRATDWRIWLRSFDGSPARQLSADEPGRHHCCPHLSPNGQQVAYLSLARGRERYPRQGAGGILRVVRIDGGSVQTLPGRARTYFEHRAAVWRNDDQLIYIDGRGRTRLFRLSSGENLPLIDNELPRHGWLVDASLRWATQGDPTFSPYDPEQRQVEAMDSLGGCEPYFSHDGRWGFWAAGAGGPLQAMELAERRSFTLLRKNDPLLPAGQGYLYFPMLSRDSRWLAFAASPNQHDHQRSNYDLFVVETDPDSLTIVGRPQRLTIDPGTDRYPDLWAEPLYLGRHRGEAPLTVEFKIDDDSPENTDWNWRLGDGATARGQSIRYRWSTPGTYIVEASRGQLSRLGVVRVLPARAPQAIAAIALGSSVLVRFDEPIRATPLQAELASGQPILARQLGDPASELLLLLGGDLTTADTLRLAGISDLAEPANLAPPQELPIAAPSWPSDPRGLLLRWPAAAGAESESGLAVEGAARLAESGGLLLSGGRAYFDSAPIERLYKGARRTHELTVELLFTADERSFDNSSEGTLLSFSGSPRSRNLTLVQRADRLWLRLRTPSTGKLSNQPQIELATLPRGRPIHLLVSYSSGRLQAYLDGRKVLHSTAISGGFYHWQPRPLVLGKAWSGGRTWYGRVGALAFYDRILDAGEARANARLAQLESL